jgi:hypothetical protein
MNDERGPDKGMAAITVIWIAMLAALPLYLLMGLLAAPNMRAAMDEGTFDLLRKALYLIGLVLLFAAGAVRRLIWNGEHRAAGLAPGPAAAAMQRYMGAVIASLAMCEGIGVFGLLLYLLGKNANDLFLLLGISAAAMVHYRPKREELGGWPAAPESATHD